MPRSKRNVRSDGYRKDLAYIHDVGYGGFALNNAAGFLRHLRDCGVESGCVVDLGCGSGLWARALVDAGYSVVGIDQSSAMIALSRDRVPEGVFHRGSYLTARIPPCDAVTSIGECLGYLFDESNNLRNLERLFRRVYEALRPGGVFLFDMAAPGRVAGSVRNYRYGEDWAILHGSEEDQKTGILTRHIVTFRKVGRFYRRDEETHRLKLYKREVLLGALRRVGFRARTVRDYGGPPFPKGLVGYLARKPKS